jgi:hypothetical protein
MLILPLALVVGLLFGRTFGGTFRTVVELRFRHSSLVLGAITLQLVLGIRGFSGLPSNLRFLIVVSTYVAVGWWLLANARALSGGRRYGLGMIATGWALNLLAIVLNGGMPVSESALRRAGFAPSTSIGRGHLSKHVQVGAHTALRILGDVIPVPWLRSVISPGDIVMALGIALLVAAGMKVSAHEGLPVSPRESSRGGLRNTRIQFSAARSDRVEEQAPIEALPAPSDLVLAVRHPLTRPT